MDVRDIMTKHVITVGHGEPVLSAVRLLRRYNLGALPVCGASGELRGMITDRDILLRCAAQGDSLLETRVSEVMSRAVVTAAPGDSVAAAAGVMARERVRRLPVCDGKRLVGLLSVADLARSADCRDECAAAVEGISAVVTKM